MSPPPLSSELVHASAVAIGGRAVLLAGRSGAGKSDLALRLIDRGAELVADDYTLVKRERDRLVATAPERIAGRMEIRGIGIVAVAHAASAPVALVVDLDHAPERMPEPGARRPIAGITVPVVSLVGHEPSAPIKVEQALRLLGLG